MHNHYKLEEIALKNLTRKNVSLNDSNNKIKLLIYYPKFNTTNLVSYNNVSSSTSHLTTNDVVCQFKYPLRENLLNEISMYVCLTTTTLLRRLILPLSDTSSISEYLKTHSN